MKIKCLKGHNQGRTIYLRDSDIEAIFLSVHQMSYSASQITQSNATVPSAT